MIATVASRDDARSALRAALAVDLGSSDSDSRFEVLRSAVWALSGDSRQVYVAKVVNAVLAPWRLLSPELSDHSVRSEIRGALDQLQDAGDLVHAAGGLWSPAFTRAVRLEESAGCLLVGGAPVALFGTSDNLVTHHGPYRRLHEGSPARRFLTEESQASWARMPEQSLDSWAQDLVASLDGVPYTPSVHDSFEFYSPQRTRRYTPQFKRWTTEPETPNGLVLARRHRVTGAREYRLVDVVSKRIVRTRVVPATAFRRMMYALDAAAQNPVRVRTAQAAGRRTLIILDSEIPHPEQRVLAALGTLRVPDDRRYQRHWLISTGHHLAFGLLRSLGIDIASAEARGGDE